MSEFIEKKIISNIIVSVLFFSLLIFQSPLLLAIGIRGIYTLPISFFLIIFILIFSKRKVKNFGIIFGITILLTASICAIFWGEFKFVYLAFWLINAILLASIATKDELTKFVEAATNFLIILVIGAIIGFGLAFSGINSLGTIDGEFGRIHCYYTTLTNSRLLNFIRPGGIYDEPGAFSFFICIIAYLRNILNLEKTKTLYLLLGGLITFSIMHLFFIFLFFLSKPLHFKKFLIWAFLVSILLIILIFFGVSVAFQELLIDRTFNFVTNFNDNDRVIAFYNCIDIIKGNWWVFLFGINPYCLFDIERCVSNFEMICCNPLEPITSSGIFISWPYYLGISFLFLSIFLRKNYILIIGLVLLFFQRSGIYSPGYSLAFVLCAYLNLKNNYKFNL
jgi:hypothetical protein